MPTLLGGPGYAQVALQPVTITVTRTEANPFDVPAAVDAIDGQRLRDAGRAEVQLSESLALVPGVTARDRQNFAQDLQLSVRGFGARSTFGVRGVRLYVDGVPATMPDGQGQLSHFDLSSAGRVEILRGPFSALYGNSSGGVLQLFTEKGEGAPVVTGSIAAGSDGLLRPSLRAVGASGGLGYHVSANHFRTEGWRDHSSAQRDVGNLRLDWNDWMLVANTVDIKADDPLGLTRTQFEADPRAVDPVALSFNTRKTVRQSQLGLVHEHGMGGGHKLRVLAYGGERTTVQFQSIPPGPQANPLHPGGVIDLERRYAGTDIRWSWKQEALELVAGLSYDHLQEARRGWQNFIGATLGVQGALRRDERNTVSNLDPYVQAQWKPGPAWTLVAGVRHSSVRFRSEDQYIAGTNGDDSGSVRYGASLPVVSAMYAVSPQLHVYGAAGRGFETPTFNELAYRPDGVPGLNFGLRPSHSRNLELGAKAKSDPAAEWRHEATAAVFSTRTKDEIVTQSNTGGRSTSRNAAATERRGVELSGQVSSSKGWRLSLAHTWLDARYDDAVGARIPGIARSFTAAEAAWQPAQGWRTGAELRRSGRVFVNDANTDAAGAWWTLALHAGWKQDFGVWSLEAAARIDNALDRRYAGSVIVNEGNTRYFEAAPGRQASVKLVASRRL